MRFYRALLYLYPSAFRAEYRDELCRTFAERVRGRAAPAAIIAAIADVVPNAIAARWDMLRLGGSGGMALATTGSDIRFALRQIARAPLFSSVVIVVIALGIGINAGLLTTLNTYAWHAAPGIPSDAKLARLMPTAGRGKTDEVGKVFLSYPDILALREEHGVFAEVAAWSSTSLPADFGGGAESVRASYTTDNFFRALRVGMAAGVGFPQGVEQTATPIVVIGHSLWVTNFGGSDSAIGKTIRLMNRPFTIVGVAPPLFAGPDVVQQGYPSIWIPLGARVILEPDASDDLTRRDAMILKGVARLSPGVKPGDVGRRTAVVAARLAQQAPQSHRRLAVRAERLTGYPSDARDRGELVAAFVLVAALVVVITCTNVSALLLGRAVARRREIAVRLSLGATRIRLIRQMLTEALVLAFAGAALGLLLYTATIKIAYATIPEAIYGLEPQPATFAYAAFFALASTIVFGLAPALHATRTDIGEAMKNSGTLAIKRSRLQALFVVIQLACSQPVLVVTSLVLADIASAVHTDADKAPASVVTMNVDLVSSAYFGESARESRQDRAAAARATLSRMQQRIAGVPGVRSAAVTAEGATVECVDLHCIARGESNTFQIPGGGAPTRMKQSYVTLDYFATLGIPIIRGRAIDRADDRRGSFVAVVNEEAANLLWPHDDPIGKRLVRHTTETNATATLEVIGIAGAAPHDEADREPAIYAPLSTAGVTRNETIAVRTPGDARAFLPAVRAAIRDVEPLATVDNAATLAERDASRRREATQINLAAFAVAASALTLASLGLYAIIAFAVEQRTREIGLRMAIGATAGDVVRQFFGNGVKVTAIGLAIGLPVTIAGIRVVKASVLGLTLQNVAAVAVVVPALILVAALASWLPARRAGQVDPLVALRSE